MTAAEALGQQQAPQVVRPLIEALWDAEVLVRAAAAQALGQVAHVVSDAACARSIARALWKRLTDWIVREDAYEALEQIANRIAVLEVASTPIGDPFALVQTARRPWWKQFVWAMPPLVILALLDFFRGVLINVFSDRLPLRWLPAGTAGLILLVFGAVILFIVFTRLQKRGSRSFGAKNNDLSSGVVFTDLSTDSIPYILKRAHSCRSREENAFYPYSDTYPSSVTLGQNRSRTRGLRTMFRDLSCSVCVV
jgi:hypothetical protein